MNRDDFKRDLSGLEQDAKNEWAGHKPVVIGIVIAVVIACIVAFAYRAHAASQTLSIQPGDTITITAPTTPNAPPTTQPPTQPPTVPSGVTIVPLDWANPQRVFSAAQLVALEFTTGSTDSGYTLARIAGAEYSPDGPSDMSGFFSAAPCDEAHKLGPTFGPSKSLTASFAIGSGSGFGFYPVLALRTRYYLCVKTDGGNKFYDLSRWGLV